MWGAGVEVLRVGSAVSSASSSGQNGDVEATMAVVGVILVALLAAAVYAVTRWRRRSKVREAVDERCLCAERHRAERAG